MSGEPAPAEDPLEEIEEAIMALYGSGAPTPVAVDVGELHTLFHLSRDLVAITGFDGYFQLLNPAWGTALGYTQAALRSQPFIEFVHPEDRERTITCAQRLQANGQLISFQNRYRCSDGSYRPLAWRATVSVEKQRYYSVTQDLTERALAQEQASLLGTLMEATDEAILVVSGGLISSWNPAAERLLGYPAERALGRPLASLVAPGREDELRTLLERADDPSRATLVLVRDDGRPIPVSLSVARLSDRADRTAGTLLLARPLRD